MESPRKPRRLLPAPLREPPQPIPRIFVETKSLNSKRETVKTACEACRKRKVKCDGRRPSCRPCLSGNVACQYSLPEGMSTKEAQTQQLERLKQTNIDLLVALDSLRRASEADSEAILKRIRQSRTLDGALDMISQAVLLLPPPMEPNAPLNSNNTSGYGSESVLDIRSTSKSILPISLWTSICQDNSYLTHLLSLFWTWDNTLSQILDRSMFLEELISGDIDKSSFCSEFLVNSLLSVAWIYSRRGGGLADSSTPHGRDFADKALNILEVQKHKPKLTLLQGLAMLVVYEVASGNFARSTVLLDQLCLLYEELQLHEVDEFLQNSLQGVSVEKSRRTVSLAAWGFYCLGTKLSLSFARRVSIQKPGIPAPLELRSSGSSSIGCLWAPYPNTTQTRLSYSKLSFSASCRLAELADRVTSSAARRGDDGKITMLGLEQLNALYPELMGWKAAAPDMHHASISNLPSFVTLSVTFDMILLRLLEPFSQQPFPGPGHPLGSISAAIRGTSLMATIWSYRSAYGIRDDYWLIQACFAAAKSLLPNLEPGSVYADAFSKACYVLFEAGENLPLANQLFHGVQGLVAQHKIDVPTSTRKLFSALAARSGKVRLKDVRLALSADATGANIASDINPTSAHDVIFSDMIRDITRINFLN